MKLRLLTKLLLCILPPALLGLGVVAGLSYRSAKKALEAQIAEEMTLVVERQTSELRSVALVLREVVKNAAEGNRIATADQVRGIATASEQQSASSEEISRSITQVNTIAAETARAMEEAARAVSDLAGQARILTGLIEEMKRG